MLGIGLGIWQLGGNRNLTSASGVAAGLYLDTKANSAFVSGLPSDLASILNVVRATTAMDEYSDGSLISVGTNVARYGGGRGLLIERGATNLVLNSDTLSTQSVTVSATQYTLSFYGTGSITLSGTSSGTVNGSGAFPSRVTSTFTPTAGSLTLTVSGSVTFAQLETGPKATAYIPTAAASVTRNSDQIKITGSPLTAGIGAGTAFTVFAEYEAYVHTNISFIGGLANDAAPSSAERITLSIDTARAGSGAVVSASANTFTNAAATLAVPPLLNRVAMRVAANDAAISHNGAAIITDPTVTMPATTLDMIVLGSAPYSIGVQALNGRLTRFAAWPSLLSNADLVALST